MLPLEQFFRSYRWCKCDRLPLPICFYKAARQNLDGSVVPFRCRLTCAPGLLPLARSECEFADSVCQITVTSFAMRRNPRT
jgi:hypothetical protein